MIRCETAEAYIQDSLEGSLSTDDRRRLDEHLLCCDQCRAAQEEYRSLARLTRQWARPEKPDTAADRALAESIIKQAATRTFYPAQPARRPLDWAGVCGACTALVAAAFAVHGLGVSVPANFSLQAPSTAHALNGFTAAAAGLSPAWSTVPSDLLGLFQVAPAGAAVPANLAAWIWPALCGAVIINVLCYLRAAQSSGRWSR